MGLSSAFPSSPSLRRRMVAAAAAALIAGTTPVASWALSLGNISVSSALGEPLRAEIRLLDAQPAQIDGLRVSLASPDAFRATGLEYNPVLSGLRLEVVRQEGRQVLRLSAERPVSDPFIDLLVVAEWPGGRIVRSYTVLIDPPNVRAAAPQLPGVAAPVPPAEPAAAPPAPAAASAGSPAAPATPAGNAVPPTGAAAAPPQRTPPGASAPAAGAVAAPKAKAAAAGADRQVRVERGDTASAIARDYLEEGVSLDQILLAMLQANPQAFIDQDINRLRADVTLTVPNAEEASRTPAREASRTLWANSSSFNAYRRKVAEATTATATPQASREATGKVEARVNEPQAEAASQDRLTLSKGAVSVPGPADTGARGDAAARSGTPPQATGRPEFDRTVAELNRTLAEMDQLKQSAGTPQVAPAAGAPASSGNAEPPAPAAGSVGPAVTAPAAANAAAPAAGPTGSTEAARTLIDDLLEQPAVPWAGAALVGLLALLAAVRVRQRRDRAPDPDPQAAADNERFEPFDVRNIAAAQAAIAAHAAASPTDTSAEEWPAETEADAPAVASENASHADAQPHLMAAASNDASLHGEATAGAPPQPLDFDSLGIDLDLQTPAATGEASVDGIDTDTLDPLSTRLALASEFQSLGDVEGARALIDEVMAQADGEIRHRAQRMRAELG